jgi:hypothetical protein
MIIDFVFSRALIEQLMIRHSECSGAHFKMRCGPQNNFFYLGDKLRLEHPWV